MLPFQLTLLSLTRSEIRKNKINIYTYMLKKKRNPISTDIIAIKATTTIAVTLYFN